MINASTHVSEVLSGITGFNAAVFGNIFWGIAPENTPYPFVVFKISMKTLATKERFGDFSVDVFVFSKTLKNSATIFDQLLDSKPRNWHFSSAESDYTSDDAREAYIKGNFDFKL